MTPSARRLFAISVAARLPQPMLSIGLLVHVQRLTGSFAAAGLVAAVYASAVGVGGPLLARTADRDGQTGVLAGGAAVAGSTLGAIAAVPAGAPPAVFVALAALLGLSVPPIGACWRALLPTVAGPAAYAADATAVELTFIAGPPLVLVAGNVASTGAALAGAGALLIAGTAAFASHPASRGARPAAAERPRGGSLRSGGIRTLALVMLAAGAVFGATEVGVTASADALGATAAAGPLLAVWGAGSLVGGLVAARTDAGLPVVLAALAAGHLALAVATGSVLALGLVIALAGSTIAPTTAIVYSMVERAAPAGTLTEAFAWLATAAAIGTAAGSALAGAVADAAGPVPTFVLAGAAGAAAVLIASLRAPATSLIDPCAAPA